MGVARLDWAGFDYAAMYQHENSANKTPRGFYGALDAHNAKMNPVN